MSWSIVLANQASRAIRRAPAADRTELLDTLRQLSADPYAGDIKLLKGTNTLRRRVGQWRILYELHRASGLIMVTAIRRRNTHTY